jgi:hypothetical protein
MSELSLNKIDEFITLVNSIISKDIELTNFDLKQTMPSVGKFTISRENIRYLILYLEKSYIESLNIEEIELYKSEYMKLYNYFIELYRTKILPVYLHSKLDSDNLEYSSKVDRFVKYHWVENNLKNFTKNQYYYSESEVIIKRIFELVQLINNRLNIEDSSFQLIEFEDIQPNTVFKILQSDKILREASERGEIRLNYRISRFSTDQIYEEFNSSFKFQCA